MSIANTAIGMAGFAGAMILAIDATLKGPEPFELHSIEYFGGMVRQERTITTDAPRFYAHWTAQVVLPDGSSVPECTGSGDWAYKAGRGVYEMTLQRWVGSEACTPESLPQNVPLRLVAAWSWGEDQTGGESKPFIIAPKEVTE